MAEISPSQEELAQRRRARRRLVGAVALALLAVVVLPMVFDPEPRPLGDQVDIRIPDQKTPFEPPPAPADLAAAPVAEPLPAEPAAAVVEKPAPAVAEPVAPPAAKAQPASKPEPKAKAESRPVAEKPSVPAKAVANEGYYLQLGVFSSQANAEQMIAKAKVAGFKASSIRVGGQYKVRVGPVAERDKALDYQAKLKSRGLDNVLVEP